MREILFRAKQNYTKEWLYGAVVKDGDECLITVGEPDGLYKQKMTVVEESTVGQFTGLTDKNGKRVFEGDIIKHNNTHFVVEFSSNHLGFICIDRKHKTRGGFANWRDGNWMKNVSSYIQIIGNIHDNPELLEAKS